MEYRQVSLRQNVAALKEIFVEYTAAAVVCAAHASLSRMT